VAVIKKRKTRLLFAVVDALVDLKSESVKKNEDWKFWFRTPQDSPSRRHVGLANGSVQSHVTVVHEVATSGGGGHSMLVSVCSRGEVEGEGILS